MDKERLLQMAELVIDANDIFKAAGRPHTVRMEVSNLPEVVILANWNGNAYLNHYRYKAVSPLMCDKLDPDFKGAEKMIKQLIEEVAHGSNEIDG